MKSYHGITSLVDILAEENDTTKKEAREQIENTLGAIKVALKDEEKDGVQFIDFLTLQRKNRKPRLGRNPKKPEETYEIPAKIGIKASLGKEFDKELNA